MSFYVFFDKIPLFFGGLYANNNSFGGKQRINFLIEKAIFPQIVRNIYSIKKKEEIREKQYSPYFGVLLTDAYRVN